MVNFSFFLSHQKKGMLFATFDGHGQFGHLVSRYFQKHLCASVVKHPSWVTDPARAMRDCMLQREKELNQGRAVDTQLSGTTAVFALVRGDQLTVLNAGDSRLILGVRDSVTGRVVPKEITHDNKPDNPLEQARIEANGGRVWAMKYDDGIDGPARVWLKDQNIPGLAMSRSLCDEVAKRAGVISEPEIYHEHLGSDVVYLCMLSWCFVFVHVFVFFHSVGGYFEVACLMLCFFLFFFKFNCFRYGNGWFMGIFIE